MTPYALEPAGRHRGWQVWALVRQRLDVRGAGGFCGVAAQREPVAILLHRAGETRAFPLTAEAADPEQLAGRIREAR